MAKKLKLKLKQKLRLKIGDLVELIAGRDKGRSGKIEKIIIRADARVLLLVKGCNMVKKHVKANPEQNKPGGILKQEAPIDISNVKIVQQVAAA